MKKCNICGVDVATNHGYCPLCYNDIDRDANPPYPLVNIKTHNVPRRKIGVFLMRLFLAISLAAFGVCLFVNLETHSNTLWSMIVLTSIVYVWILVAHTILSRRSMFEKVLFQILGIVAIVGTTYALYPGIGDNWLISFVLPGISMLVVAVLLMYSIISKHRKSLLLSFVVVYIGLLILAIIFRYTIDTYKTINNICILVCSIVSVGTILVGYKSIHKEFIRVFNL